MSSILIIEPSPELRRFVAALLSGAGHGVREAPDMQLAVTLLRDGRATHLVTDLLRCGRPGGETLLGLRDEFPEIEIVPISRAPQSAGYLRLAATLDAPTTLAQSFMSSELMELSCPGPRLRPRDRVRSR